VIFPPWGIHFHGHDRDNVLPEILFINAVFPGGAKFHRVTFGGAARFDGATFDDILTSFDGATFDGEARFGGASFVGRVEFNNVVFKDRIDFNGVTFGYDAEFKNAIFASDALFEGDPTREGPAGHADIFRGFVTFQGAQFQQRAIFINRRFLNSTDFRDVLFKIAPEFHNAVLHQDTDFLRAQFPDRLGTEYVNAIIAYRTLKLAMESVRARDEEAQFYGYEQQSLRARRDTSRSIKVASWLYEGAADYGQSFVLPLSWLFISLFVFGLVYALIGGAAMWGDWQGVLRFALQQVFQPFAAFRTLVGQSTPQPVPLCLALVASLHSLLTFAFLALFLLALRRRYRLN
jgi:hypothetical protein